MAGLEATDNAVGQINPSQLIGQATPIVEPRATAILADAFRQGVVTADDVLSRIGELGQTKKKAELQMTKEAISPQAQAARAQQLAAATAQGQLGAEQATAAMGNVEPAAALQAQQIEQQKVLIQYPAVAYFQKLAPAAGIETPKLPDGTPDYAQMEKIGAELAVHQSKKAEAQQQLENITTQDSADGTVLFSRTKQGEFVDPKKVQQLRSQAFSTFQRQAPGTAAGTAAVTAPVVEARAATPMPANMDAARAQLANSGMPPEEVVGLSDVEVASRLAQPAAVSRPSIASTAAPIAPVGTPTGGGISLGAPKSTNVIKAPTEAQQRAQLALSRFAEAGDIQTALKDAGYDPTSIGSWMNSLLPEIAKSGDRKQYDAAVNAWSQGLLRLESGAAISPHEKAWYNKAFFPQVRDPEATVLAKEAMRHDVERMVAEIAQAGGVVSPESATQAQRVYQQAESFSKTGNVPKAVGPALIVPLPSGKKITRDKNGQYHYVE